MFNAQKWSRLKRGGFICFLVLGLLIQGGCKLQLRTPPIQAPQSRNLAALGGVPLSEGLSKLDPSNQKFFLDFATSVPKTLPAMAYVSTIFMNPMSPDDGPRILEEINGNVSFEIAMLNAGTNTNDPHLLCLQNGSQIPCATNGDVWAVHLAPQSIAFIPISIQGKSGDVLSFLFLANSDIVRPRPASQSHNAYIQKVASPTLPILDLAPHEAVAGFEGCDFGILIHDPYHATASENMHFYPDGIKETDSLYLLLRVCEPKGQVIRLAPILDRRQVLSFQGDVWSNPVRLGGETTVIPIPVEQIPNGTEFQIAILPVNDTADVTFHSSRFTQAIPLQK